MVVRASSTDTWTHFSVDQTMVSYLTFICVTLIYAVHAAWIGLNSLHNPSRPRVFSWSDGTPVTYTPWDISAGSTDLHGDLGSLLQSNCVAGSPNVPTQDEIAY